MNESQVRKIIAEALVDASVTLLHEKGLTKPFLDGEKDVAFEELEMDSLSVMELCILIEESSGISLESEDLKSMTSLNALVQTMMSHVAVE